MQAGNLDRRITIQRYSETGQDGAGNQTLEWADLSTVRAGMRQESGREFFAYGATNAERKVVFTIRPTDVSTEDRIVYDGQEHEIHSVRELGRNEGLELHTTATS